MDDNTKDQFSRPLKRTFAPNKRPTTEDRLKVRIIKSEPKYDIEVVDKKVRVKKHEKNKD